MTKPIDPYSRVYWRVAEDERFAGIYPNDNHLATWLRLLMLADAMYPTAAPVPATAKARSVTALTDCGLIELLPGGLYRVHGLKSERERRGRVADPDGTPPGSGREPHGNLAGTPREPVGTLARAGVDETRQDKTSRDEQDDPRDSLDRYHELTGYRPWAQWSGDALVGLERDYGMAEVVAALDTEYASDGTRDTLLKRASARVARNAEHAKRAKAKVLRPRLEPIDEKARNAVILELMGTRQDESA